MPTEYEQGAGRLVVVAPANLRGQELTLSGQDAVVGRGAGSQLILADPHVSRTHAVIRTAGDGVLVEDLGSFGGTKVNGAPAVAATALRDGDVISFAGVSVRYEAAGPQLDRTWTGTPPLRPPAPPLRPPAPPTRSTAAPDRSADRPASVPAGARYDIGQQHADVISNVGRDQYNAYVQQRESFLREVAATKSKARLLAWLGFALLVLGFVVYGGTILRFIQRVPTIGENGDVQDPQLLGPDFLGVPVGVFGLGLYLLGSVLLIVGIVLHIVAAARRRRVERDMPAAVLPHPYRTS
jgi:FHA domain